MSELRRLVMRLLSFLRAGRAERELTREMTAHLRQIEDDFIRKGLPPEEARLAARRAFGGVEQAKESQRDARSIRWLDELRQNVALRDPHAAAARPASRSWPSSRWPSASAPTPSCSAS